MRALITTLKVGVYGFLVGLIALIVAVFVAMGSLPSYDELVRRNDLGQMIRVHAADGSVLVSLGPSFGEWLSSDEIPQIMAEAHRQLARIGLADRAHELAGSLPLGTQRILEIARALAADPVLLVLDEPAAGLRRKEKQALGDLLRKLRDEGVTILIVEHDMDFVMKLVDRLVVMTFGSKLVEGSPAAVRADPRVQAAYLGSVIEKPEEAAAAPVELVGSAS